MSVQYYHEIQLREIKHYLSLTNDELFELSLNRVTLEYQRKQLQDEIDKD
jgi:hypothetical protein